MVQRGARPTRRASEPYRYRGVCSSYREFFMQIAIERIFRSLSFRPFGLSADNQQPERSRDEATTLAVRLLQNYQTQLVGQSCRPN
jgi:hypothetical protein